MHSDYRKGLLAELARIDQQIANLERLTVSECDDEISSIVVDEGFCQAATSWDLTPSVN